MNKIFFPLLCVLLFMAGCAKDEISTSNQDPTPVAELNKIVFEKLNTHNQFYWNMVDDHTVWSALVQSDQILSIGYKPADVTDVRSIIHQVDINDADWTEARAKVINTITEILKDDPEFNPARDIYVKDVLPVIILKTNSFKVVETLRAMDQHIRYVEPMGYNIDPDITHNDGLNGRSDSGCGGIAAASGHVQGTDYRLDPTYSNIVPWTYDRMNVQTAWDAGLDGDNITVAMFDTGTSDDQYNLRSGFAKGKSTGRYIRPRSTHYTTTGFWWWQSTTLDSPDDQCGHGTQMSGNICAPKSSGGGVMGVAWKANLLAYRVSEDVIIGASHEKDAVSDAFVEIADEGDAKIVSMSLGDIFGSGQVEDAVVYARNSGILIFCAAGTSLDWTSWYGVIFPAWLNETVAVTGVKDQSNYSRCDACHDGSDVDFVVKMEKSNGHHALTQRYSGNSPAWVGGSSTATAHMAGVAALVWGDNPGDNRTGILNKLKNASQNYPSRSGSYGWGTVDLGKVVQ